jgi:hypothetical protein
MSVLGASNEQQLILAAIGRRRASAKSYRERAAAMRPEGAAAMLIALSRDCEEEAVRLEVKMILARTIETTGG